MRDGLLSLDGDAHVGTLFGGAERRRTLQVALRAMLKANAVYVLTANMAYKRVEEALNQLLESPGGGNAASNGSAVPVVRFTADENVFYCPAGTKLERLQQLADQRGFVLVR